MCGSHWREEICMKEGCFINEDNVYSLIFSSNHLTMPKEGDLRAIVWSTYSKEEVPTIVYCFYAPWLST